MDIKNAIYDLLSGSKVTKAVDGLLMESVEADTQGGLMIKKIRQGLNMSVSKFASALSSGSLGHRLERKVLKQAEQGILPKAQLALIFQAAVELAGDEGYDKEVQKLIKNPEGYKF
jgi:hypothetical protein